jgi:hypothetical protein
MSMGARSGQRAEGTARPIQVARRTWEWWGGLDNAACQSEEYTASIDRAAGMSGSWLQRLKDL